MLSQTHGVQMISFSDYVDVSTFAFSDKNPGYNSQVIESPNGDGVWDKRKKYAHLAPKYFDVTRLKDKFSLDYIKMRLIYRKAVNEAAEVCKFLDLPPEFYPGPDSTMRVLWYPKGATTAPHTDFDLFTICMYRNQLDSFIYLDDETEPSLELAKSFFPGIHFGELMTEVNGMKATKHEVIGTEESQQSIVFFVVPPHQSVLPSGQTVGDWIMERKYRSRKPK